MEYILHRNSHFKQGEEFCPGPELEEAILNANILVIGAGGLGCEILKNLAITGFKNIYVIDLDTIELTNLNRQFLFRKKDIGKFKAEVATEFIKTKYPEINIKWSNRKVQSYPLEFFSQFNVIIGGLDNMEARLWLNDMIHNLAEFDENGNLKEETLVPYVDGGTVGFRGNNRLIIPYKTSCLECTRGIETDQKVYALCTIAETPRVPEHCIQFVYLLKWKDHFDRPVDKDSIEDVNWIYERAKERAESYGIQGVTYNLTLGVIKNVIPAIASTNAIIAAASCLEAIKLLSYCSKVLDNNFLYLGLEGLHSMVQQFERNEKCNVCNCRVNEVNVRESVLLRELLESLAKRFGLTAPAIYDGNNLVFMSGAGALADSVAFKLEKSLKELAETNEFRFDSIMNITDNALKHPLKIKNGRDHSVDSLNYKGISSSSFLNRDFNVVKTTEESHNK